jgi:dihydropteroate synthase
MFAPYQWPLAHGRSLELGPVARIMGVLNVTPDSFSDGGSYVEVEAAIAQAEAMIAEGADIIDIGGESTRPGAAPVDAAEEQRRVLPLIEALAGRDDVLISVDTYREDTARKAIEAGAHIVNDVWGLQREPGIARVAADTGAGLVVMHTGREREKLTDVIDDQIAFLRRSLEIAAQAGVEPQRVILDPGFGFAKETAEENLDLMSRLGEIFALGCPLLIGTSRKRFIGTVTGREPAGRDAGTAATSVITRLQGGAIFRVHNVVMSRDALLFADEMIRRGLTAQMKAQKE